MKIELTALAYKILNDSKSLARIAVRTDIQYPCLYRWVKAKHENLTLYRVLYALSEISGKKVDDLVNVTE